MSESRRYRSLGEFVLLIVGVIVGPLGRDLVVRAARISNWRQAPPQTCAMI